MLKIGPLALDGTPRIAVAFTDSAKPSDITAAIKAGLDVAEIRIDHFRSLESSHVLTKLSLFKHLPTLATIRLENEGGLWRGSEAARQVLFQTIIPHVDAVDVELASKDTLKLLAPIIHQHGKLLVASYHHMTSTPSLDDLESIVLEAKASDADIVKIATMVTIPEHVSVLAALLVKHADKNLIVIGMGASGLSTRLFFPALGSLLTFAAIAGQAYTPGQMPYMAMFDLMRQIYPRYNEQKISQLEILESA